MKRKLLSLFSLLTLFGGWQGQAQPSSPGLPSSLRQARRDKPDAVARHQKHKQNFPALADVVLIGDSMARRWKSEGLQALFENQRILNLGVGGDRTENVLWRLNDLPLRKISPRTVMVFVGTNNLKQASDSADDIVRGVEAIVERVHSAWPGAAILVMPVLPRGPHFSFREKDRVEINERLARNSSHRFVLVDEAALTCGGSMKEDSADCPNYSEDRLHLLPPGYAVLNQALALSLSSVP